VTTTGTGQHPEVSEISDLTDGLLSPSRAADLRDHLASCALCEDVYESLEEIRGLLGTLPGPSRMPADVAGRIDAALAAEALLDATTPATGTMVSRETPSEPSPVSRETGESRPSRPRRWPRLLLGTAAAAAVFGLGGLLVQNSATDGAENSQDRPTAATEQSEGGSSALTSATLGSHVHDLLKSKGAHKSPEMGTRSSPETPLRGGADTVPSCVRQGIGRTESPLASTQSRYGGKDAFLVVLPHPSDPSQVSAYIVSSSCISATPPTPGKVLLSHSYQRD
jgi:anti-sigma factor RsiW